MIYASTACLSGPQPIMERIAAYRAAGLAALELGANITLVPGDLERVQLLGGDLLVHNYFPPPAKDFVLNLASQNADTLRQSLEMVKAALQLSSRFKAPFYSVHGGFITDAISFDGVSFVFPMPQGAEEAGLARQRFTRVIAGLLPEAEHYGVTLLVENNVCAPQHRGKLILQEAWEFEELFTALPSPHLGMLLDTGHLNVTATTLVFDRLDFVRRVAPFVRAVHFHDNNGSADQHRPPQPGSWTLDVLRMEPFKRLPIIIEARFEALTELVDYAGFLQSWLEQ
jgi:sugar phosphate isomerase/epimerase